MIPLEVFDEPDFRSALVDTITRMSIEEVASVKPTASKAGHQQIEDRETTDPAIVTDFLATFLSAFGRLVKVPVLKKNTREQVSWNDAFLPWRRSPVWLLCRIMMQSILSRRDQAQTYKQFMVFLMALILEAAVVFKLSSETLYCIVAKISGRLRKLGPKAHDCLQGGVAEILARAVSYMEKTWQATAASLNPDLMMHAIPASWYQEDQTCPYPALDEFIRSINLRKPNATKGEVLPSLSMPKWSVSELPNLSQSHQRKDQTLLQLLELERWVSTSLDSWLNKNIGGEETPGKLLTLMKAYHKTAKQQYEGNPEAISLMVLTLLELWIACDESACEQQELLLHFDHEISDKVLQSLILPMKGDTARLHQVEMHLKSRKQRAASHKNPSIFSSFGTSNCYAVQFFANSEEHQALKQRIEVDAAAEREKKRTKFLQEKENYNACIKRSHEIEHRNVTRINKQGYQITRHHRKCSRCALERKAAGMTIDIHEWPLPTAKFAAQNVVFELCVPVVFSSWRDATAFMISAVLQFSKSSPSGSQTEEKLSTYLRTYFSAEPHSPRFVLASTTKSNGRTHRNNVSVRTAKEADVLLKNGLNFRYYDEVLSQWASSFLENGNLAGSCTFKLPAQCSSLQKFLNRTHELPNGEPANCIISRQSECPENLSLEEFRAMASLPCGYRLQWLNILGQLYAPTADFANHDVLQIIRQISGQVGPPEDISYRAGHQLLRQESFALTCVASLEASLGRIQENWESYHALNSLVTLTGKLLSFSTSEFASQECLQFLHKCRIVAQKWMALLQEKIKHSETESVRAGFQESILQVAWICIASFDVEDWYLQLILDAADNAATLIEASITAHDAAGGVDSQDVISAHRCAKTLFKSHENLKGKITAKKDDCLDVALQRSWAAYPGGATWRAAQKPYQNLVMTTITTQEGQKAFSVNYNLLTGELLVNGNPLARLPTKYEQHSLYATLFGRMTLEVLPTDMPGMELSSKKSFHGYTLFFGLEKTATGDLLVAAKSESRVYQIIPSRVFLKSLPHKFINDYIHWYDQKSQTIEFRDKNDPWRSLPNLNWFLHRSGQGWTLKRQDRDILLSSETSTAMYLARLMKPLEAKPYIHVLLQEGSNKISVEMPRLQLDFWIDAGSEKLYSRQFRRMYLDSKQCIGTLVGLKNRLVLRNEQNRRKVLIPDGEPTWSRDPATGHVQVSIPHGKSEKVHAYDIDSLLQRLVDNGSAQSKLVLCHLHALTSHCLPDGLIGKTGTEQALCILSSASLRSFEYLKEEDVEKLTKIAHLSPSRQYYPKYLRNMEMVQWDTQLSYLSQDSAFHTMVEQIFCAAKQTKLFYPDACALPETLHFVDPDLHERHLIRAASYQVYGFGAENHSVSHDIVYPSRDTTYHSKKSAKAFQIVQMLTRSSKALLEPVSAQFVQDMWAVLGAGPTRGSVRELSEKDICYSSQWLGDTDDLLRSFWCQLHHLLVAPSASLNRFQVMLFLSTMGYATTGSLQILQALAAFFRLPNVFTVTIPAQVYYLLSQGRAADRTEIETVVKAATLGFCECPEYSLEQDTDENELDHLERRRNIFQLKQGQAVQNFVTNLHSQWICPKPTTPTVGLLYLNYNKVMDNIRGRWSHWYQNHFFYEYLLQIEDKLDSCATVPVPFLVRVPRPRRGHSQKAKELNNYDAMFALSTPAIPNLEKTELNLCQPDTELTSVPHRLATLLYRLRTTTSPKHQSERQYEDELSRSFEALKNLQSPQVLAVGVDELAATLRKHLRNCRENVDVIYSALLAAIYESLEMGLYGRPREGDADGWRITAAFMAPRTSCSTILSNLSRTRWSTLSQEWQHALVVFGVALTELQRAERLLSAGTPSDLVRELSNPGHTNWEPMENPENLLLEIESGILIREVQDDIASEMRSPANEENAVMQLNMGEGKSSVIVPMVAAYLANGAKLVRVVVGKPQAKELHRTLIAKLGGLLNRQVFHMPFNRSSRPSAEEVRGLDRLYERCMEQGGILLVQPEHMLSLKLMAIEYQYLNDQKETGTALVDLYHFFHSYSRDIVDESDENFSPKFELIYTMGEQRPMELSPDRWIVLQKLLDIVNFVAAEVQKEKPEGIEITHRSRGRFPRTRILRAEAGELLLRKVAQHICETGIPGLPIGRQSDQMRAAVFDYIFEDDVSADKIAQVETNAAFFNDVFRSPLLLVRGLIAGRVLLFALRQKRWRVNYGLDETRRPSTRLAVPYRAKDSPSTRAEFSHPDVVIILTCLSYYYEGLSDDLLIAAFTHLMKSDQAETEYNEWVSGASGLPTAFHRLSGINMKDLDQLRTAAFPHLRYSKSIVDYFLSHLVFPREMKEFSHKLSSSGWDLGAQRSHATTGFSGTNDSRHVLPLDVKQLDIQDQLHTNALVLENLLRPENKVQLLQMSDETDSSDTERLLQFAAATENEIQVILDVGAQVLELTNKQVATRWLELLPIEQKQEAVVFFNDEDDICVIDRNGVVERLQTSPYGEQLDRCLVFLDQAHTRGTDLKLPEHYRAAVTLSPDLTKDKLAQGKEKYQARVNFANGTIACMRMRKLGRGQSVIFCVSKEMQSRINLATRITQNDKIQVSHVLEWAISETHSDLRRVMPLWAMQGTRFHKQKLVWDSATSSTGTCLTKEHAASLLEEEAQTITQRYRPRTETVDGDDVLLSLAQLNLESHPSSLAAIQKRCKDFGISHFRSAALQEEQEKELAPEIEQERQVHRPDPAKPEKHTLHPDVSSFASTGIIRASSKAFRPAFQALQNTSVSELIHIDQFPDNLLVTADYARTVQLTPLAQRSNIADSFQRPVQWILTSSGIFSGTRAVIISPFEANELIPVLTRPSSRTTLHFYAPRMSQTSPSLDELRLYTIPELGEGWKLPKYLRLQLNLFAGQLYFGSFEDYVDTCNMLDLAWRPPSAEDGNVTVETDGFIVGGKTKFTKSPVQGIKVLLTTLRHDCQEIDKTHWGRILGGEFLTEADFE